jgi:hypothetical protein
MDLNGLATWATIGAFILSIVSLAFSAHRWLAIRKLELKAQRFEIYHGLVHSASSGTIDHGPMKLTSQVAYVFELRNFPEYSSLTETVLRLLRVQWGDSEIGQMKRELIRAIDDTLAHLQKSAP